MRPEETGEGDTTEYGPLCAMCVQHTLYIL
jgi:hypothetical protein